MFRNEALERGRFKRVPDRWQTEFGRWVADFGVPRIAAKFVDMDLDGDQDLVVGKRESQVGAEVYWNDGSGYFTGESHIGVPSAGDASGLKVWDHDLDLRPDLLVTTADDQGTSLFFHNLLTETGLVLNDDSAAQTPISTAHP